MAVVDSQFSNRLSARTFVTQNAGAISTRPIEELHTVTWTQYSNTASVSRKANKALRGFLPLGKRAQKSKDTNKPTSTLPAYFIQLLEDSGRVWTLCVLPSKFQRAASCCQDQRTSKARWEAVGSKSVIAYQCVNLTRIVHRNNGVPANYLKRRFNHRGRRGLPSGCPQMFPLC